MATKPAPTPSPLVSKGLGILARLKAIEAEKLELEAELIKLGAGQYIEPNGEGTCTVVGATLGSPGVVAYRLEAKAEEVAKKIAGEQFAKLFDRKVSFTPCEGFASVAPKLLTPAKSRDLLATCAFMIGGSAGKRAYVRWS